MIRKIITIDEALCNGCEACVNACHEGAIQMVDGKAKLIRDDYCDGLGDCLPTCPTNAISFEEREAKEFDSEAVKKHQHAACPGSMMKTLSHSKTETVIEQPSVSQLQQWPIQIQLVPVNAPYFDNADLLIAADCSAYAYANFHNDFMKNKITLIGCPKLDVVDYAEKLTDIITHNTIKSITIARMEVPCCGGLEYALKTALQASQKILPWQVKIIRIDGTIIDA